MSAVRNCPFRLLPPPCSHSHHCSFPRLPRGALDEHSLPALSVLRYCNDLSHPVSSSNFHPHASAQPLRPPVFACFYLPPAIENAALQSSALAAPPSSVQLTWPLVAIPSCP
eukprot:763683-Hanusia_phi.AAC.2